MSLARVGSLQERELVGPESGHSLRRVRRHGRNSSIRRIHDHRCALADLGDRNALPDRIVRSGHVAFGRCVASIATLILRHLFQPRLLLIRPFLLRQKLLRAKLFWTFKRRYYLVVPYSLQVRRAPRGPGRSAATSRGSLGRRWRLTCHWH